MRKNSPRYWLHATLDLLPVILIPVFMIYSHRHTIDSYSVTRQEVANQPYNFYQGVLNGKPNYDKDNIFEWGMSDFTYSINDDVDSGTPYANLFLSGDFSSGYCEMYCDLPLLNLVNEVQVINNVYVSFEYVASINYSNFEYIFGFDSDTGENDEIIFVPNGTKFVDIFEVYGNPNDALSNVYLTIVNNYEEDTEFEIRNIQCFNLTTIFGSGNEPTKEEFESMLTQDYYEYGNNYVDNYVMVSKTYNDTDIMSQFTYNLYNAVDKYFNMGNVFGMNNVYTWFETNIFHGTAPLYIYIVWNIILYEFVMDLLFLLYALFMWFVDVTKRLVEKPLDSIK